MTKHFRTDIVQPSGAREARSAMIGAMNTSNTSARAAFGGGNYPHADSYQRHGSVMIFRSPDAVMDYWRGLPAAEKANEEERTANAMRKLLVRPSRREFPNVPVLLDGQRMKGGMLDDAFSYLRMERLNRARAGAEDVFDPVHYLAGVLTKVVLGAWKADPMRASMWPVSERRWQENLEADESADIRVLGISFRTLAAPLLLDSRAG